MATVSSKIDRMSILQWLINNPKEAIWRKLAEIQKQEMVGLEILTEKEILDDISEAEADFEKGRVFTSQQVQERFNIK